MGSGSRKWVLGEGEASIETRLDFSETKRQRWTLKDLLVPPGDVRIKNMERVHGPGTCLLKGFIASFGFALYK